MTFKGKLSVFTQLRDFVFENWSFNKNKFAKWIFSCENRNRSLPIEFRKYAQLKTKKKNKTNCISRKHVILAWVEMN